ncbi:hypothetical protein DEU56DRAFT_12020 [Suillus clintonianus]|uniref:uncharacterized protein n=1 Tax=Suillus clintonianus TaxID=1904413 RepID=UPI001B85CC2B|nr:uncharacterized protein DEU56DRAFT_12020 [Suillus clintonianus]KAG2157271.1 hypothetical protein DEU56DRAFT_12020 [Suillus clintonianus]
MSLHQHEITESHPKPLQALLGGIGIALSVHSLLVLNGSVLGVSGFIHRSFRGDKAAMASVVGLILGGVTIGIASNVDTPEPQTTVSSHLRMVFSGLLVGIGTKLANGCTSGHMICGLSRLSLRYALNSSSQCVWIQHIQSSLVATATFFASAVATAHFVHGNGDLGTSGSLDWALDKQGRQFLGATLSLGILWFAYTCSALKNGTSNSSTLSIFRYMASFLTSLAFAFSIRLGNMVDPHRVLAFLVLPLSSAFDPTMVFIAGSALPLAALLYRYACVEQPRFGGKWNIPASTKIDWRLILGSVIFGIGWGIGGICPGPGLVNFGRSLYAGVGFTEYAAWLLSMGFGGLLVK